MALDLWTNEDIQHTVLAIAVAVVATSMATETPNAEFVKGSLASLHSVAIAYKLDWRTIGQDIQQAIGPSAWRTLDAATVALLEGRAV